MSIKVKLDEKQIKEFNDLLEMVVNSSLNFSRYDGSVSLFLDDQSGWSLQLTPDGRWKLE